MRYMLLIYGDESGAESMSEEEGKAIWDAWWAYDGAIASEGIKRAGDALQPSGTATTVRVAGGETVLTDGPFAETREQLGGFYLLDVADLDAAIAWAEKCPAAKVGTVELRPVVEFDQA